MDCAELYIVESNIVEGCVIVSKSMESLTRWLAQPLASHFTDSIMHVIYWPTLSSSPITIVQQSSVITDHQSFWKIWNQNGYSTWFHRYYGQNHACDSLTNTIVITNHYSSTIISHHWSSEFLKNMKSKWLFHLVSQISWPDSCMWFTDTNCMHGQIHSHKLLWKL